MTKVVQQQAANFETIKQAFENGDVALLECQLKSTGERVAVITAVNQEDGELCFVPFAMLFNGNPYELLNPPAANGGFMES